MRIPISINYIFHGLLHISGLKSRNVTKTEHATNLEDFSETSPKLLDTNKHQETLHANISIFRVITDSMWLQRRSAPFIRFRRLRGVYHLQWNGKKLPSIDRHLNLFLQTLRPFLRRRDFIVAWLLITRTWMKNSFIHRVIHIRRHKTLKFSECSRISQWHCISNIWLSSSTAEK